MLVATLAAAPRSGPAASLATVLDHIDQAATRVHDLTADVMSLKYTKLVDDKTAEHGKFYYQKTPRGPAIALEITDPYPRTFLYRDDTGWIYQPKIKQAQKYDLRRNRAAVSQFLLLGLGAGGHSLQQSFQVTLEPATGALIHLHLVPLAAATLPSSVASIDLWYDPTLWVAVTQQINQPSGDYQRLEYSHLKINSRISSRHFATNFPDAQIVTPQQP